METVLVSETFRSGPARRSPAKRDGGGISIVAVRHLAKVRAPVRFRYPAHLENLPRLCVGVRFSSVPSE